MVLSSLAEISDERKEGIAAGNAMASLPDKPFCNYPHFPSPEETGFRSHPVRGGHVRMGRVITEGESAAYLDKLCTRGIPYLSI
jgi:hypothetical protein